MSVGSACWFLKLQGQVALLLPWASAPQQGICRVALGQDVLRRGPGAGRLGAEILAPLKSKAQRRLSCIFGGWGRAGPVAALTLGLHSRASSPAPCEHPDEILPRE